MERRSFLKFISATKIGNEITGNPQLITPLVKPPKHNEKIIIKIVVGSKFVNTFVTFHKKNLI